MWLRLLLLLLFPISIFAATELDPYVVSIVLNNEQKPKFYHCYTDTNGKIWLPKEELELLGFPNINHEPLQYQNKILYSLTDYEKVEANLSKETLTLVLHTPVDWDSGTEIMNVPLYNGKIRPEHPGFFLITI